MTTLSPAFVASNVRYENWYDSKDEDTQLLIDQIHESTSFIIDEADYDAFIKMLEPYVGIKNAEQFEEALKANMKGLVIT